MKERKLIYAKDVADLLGVNIRTVRSYEDRGFLRSIDGGRRGKNQTRLYALEDVERLAAGLGDTMQLEKQVESLKKELAREERRLRTEINALKRGAGAYERMLSRASSVIDIVATTIETLSALAGDPFKDREIDVLRSLLAGDPVTAIARKYDVSNEMIRIITRRALRRLAERVPAGIEQRMTEKDNEIASLKSMVGTLTRANERLRLSATKKKGVTTEIIEGSVYARPIRDLFLSVRARNWLVAAGITTIGELCSFADQELLNLKNFGRTSLDDVKRQLGRLGLALGTMPRVPRLSHLYRD